METESAGTLDTEDGWYTGNDGAGKGRRWYTETAERGGRWN